MIKQNRIGQTVCLASMVTTLASLIGCPSNFILPFLGDNYVVILIVSCFGVEFCAVCLLMFVFSSPEPKAHMVSL